MLESTLSAAQIHLRQLNAHPVWTAESKGLHAEIMLKLMEVGDRGRIDLSRSKIAGLLPRRNPKAVGRAVTEMVRMGVLSEHGGLFYLALWPRGRTPVVAPARPDAEIAAPARPKRYRTDYTSAESVKNADCAESATSTGESSDGEHVVSRWAWTENWTPPADVAADPRFVVLLNTGLKAWDARCILKDNADKLLWDYQRIASIHRHYTKEIKTLGGWWRRALQGGWVSRGPDEAVVQERWDRREGHERAARRLREENEAKVASVRGRFNTTPQTRPVAESTVFPEERAKGHVVIRERLGAAAPPLIPPEVFKTIPMPPDPQEQLAALMSEAARVSDEELMQTAAATQ